METGIIIGIIAVIGIIYFILKSKSRNNQTIQIPKQIQFEELKSMITQLLNGKLEEDFFGITSDATDCLYFVYTNGTINIEFEVMENDQKPYAEKIIDFTKKNNYTLVKTTYGNKPLYSELKEAPVYKLELNADKDKATEIGIEIMKTVFNKNEMTKFDVVP